jgi:hypothetical protein
LSRVHHSCIVEEYVDAGCLREYSLSRFLDGGEVREVKLDKVEDAGRGRILLLNGADSLK